jgi:hypothetical protein
MSDLAYAKRKTFKASNTLQPPKKPVEIPLHLQTSCLHVIHSTTISARNRDYRNPMNYTRFLSLFCNVMSEMRGRSIIKQFLLHLMPGGQRNAILPNLSPSLFPPRWRKGIKQPINLLSHAEKEFFGLAGDKDRSTCVSWLHCPVFTVL